MFPFCQWPCLFLVSAHVTLLAHAGIATADDVDAGMFYSGLWVPDGDPHTFGHHDTWTNQSGASVAFDFVGTQIQVFATRRPEGTYLTNVSFAIDDGPATLWTTTDFLPEITYQNLVYTSPLLSPAQHRITITNFGQIFWLDYVQFTTADSLPDPGQGGTSSSSTKPESPPHSTTARSPPSTSHSPTTQSEGPRPSPSSSSATSSSGTPAETTTTSDTTDTLPHPAPSDTSAPIGTVPASRSAPSPTGEANASNAGGSGSSSRTPMIIGIAIGAVGALSALLTALWWLRMRRRPGGGQASVEGTTTTSVQPLVGPQPATSSSHSTNSKGQQIPVSSPPLQAPSSGASLLGNSADARYRDSEFPPSSSFEPHRPSSGPQEATSSAEYTEEKSPFVLPPAPYSPARRPLPPAPEVERALFDASVPFDTGAAAPAIAPAALALSLHSAYSTSPLSSHTVSPMVRHSRDAGIRLAGGPPDVMGSQTQMWASGGYDPTFGGSEIETLPPAYAQIVHGSAGGR